MASPPPYFDRKVEFATAVQRLDESLTDVNQQLRSFSLNETESTSLTDNGQAYLDAVLTRIHHEFDLVTDLAQTHPDGIYSADHYDTAAGPTDRPTFGIDNRELTPETIYESLDEAWAQFSVTVAPVLDALADGTALSVADADWQEFYGAGFGHSHANTIQSLRKALARDLSHATTATDYDADVVVARLDPERQQHEPPAPDADTTATSTPTQTPTPTADDHTSARDTPTPTDETKDTTDDRDDTADDAHAFTELSGVGPGDTADHSETAPQATSSDAAEEPATAPTPDTEQETAADTANAADHAVSEDALADWPMYEGETLTTPQGDHEPRATDTYIPNELTVLDVDYSMVLDPPCKYSGCPSDGRYLLTFEDAMGDTHVVRVCASDLPDEAQAIAPGHRLWKDGRMQTEGETFSKIEVANSSNYEWSERHAVSTGTDGPHDGLAYLRYRRGGDTIYITVQDNVGEHGREGNYAVEIDDYDGAIPIIDGKPVGEWLIDRAEQHRDRLLTNEGVNRHLVAIDRDQRVAARAQQAYRNQHPEFDQPGGLINDHTPVTEDCIPVCGNCGEIVAGTTLDNTEPCEYCGCEEATWMSDYEDDSEAADDATTPDAS